MNRVATSRPICRYYKTQVVVQSAISPATAEEVAALIGDVTVVDIPLTAAPNNPTVQDASRPFHVGTESLFINGLRCSAEDYVVLRDSAGNGIGIVCGEIEADDDVHLTADIVEQ